MHAGVTQIRSFTVDEWREYRNLRLRALADVQDAFGSTLDAERDRPEAHSQDRLRNGVDSVGDLPLVAVIDSNP